VTVSLTWAFVVIILRFRDFLTLHDTVSKRNPEITLPTLKLRMSAIAVQCFALIPFCDLMDLDSNWTVLLTPLCPACRIQ
jgi:hypothetical protein